MKIHEMKFPYHTHTHLTVSFDSEWKAHQGIDGQSLIVFRGFGLICILPSLVSFGTVSMRPQRTINSHRQAHTDTTHRTTVGRAIKFINTQFMVTFIVVFVFFPRGFNSSHMTRLLYS